MPNRIVIRQDGRIVGEHPRSFGRIGTIYDPWHYVPVLARKPGALRNGAPFKDWVLPAAMERVRRKLAGADEGNRQMVDILTAVLTDGLPAVEAACAEATAQGVHSADVVLNILARCGPAADRDRHHRSIERETPRPVRNETAFDRAASAEGSQENGRGAALCRVARYHGRCPNARDCGRLGLSRARPAHSPSHRASL